MNPDDAAQVIDLVVDGAMLVVLVWVLAFIVVFVDQYWKGR